MIRINLVAERKVEKSARSSSGGGGGQPGGLQLYLLLGLLGGGTALLCAGAWYLKQRDIANLDTSIAEALKRQKELQAIKAQVDAFQKKKKTLEDKVNLIERLKAEQSGPVHMLDEISKALPDLVWLSELDQTAGNLKLTGESNGLTSVADFISNLEKSGWFPRVDLVSSSEATTRESAGAPVVKFVVSAQFKDPAIAAKEKAAAAAAAAAPPPPASPKAGAKKS